MKNLLIEGMPGCGKSTAIISSLKELGLLPFCAGYRTVRIYSSESMLRGFAHYAPSEPYDVDLITDEAVPTLFLDFSKTPPLREEVLSEFTVKSLIPTGDTRCILIDEIGGRELDIPWVREAYLSALKSGIPVIGVLKCFEHAKHFSPAAYESFRRQLEEETDTEIYEMTKDTRVTTGEYILKFLKMVKQ